MSPSGRLQNLVNGCFELALNDAALARHQVLNLNFCFSFPLCDASIICKQAEG